MEKVTATTKNISKEKASVAFWLAVFPGLVGVFGMSHLYLGKRLRGEAFLVWTAALFALVLISFLPGLSTVLWTGYLPAIWGIGWLVGIYDIRRVIRKASA